MSVRSAVYRIRRVLRECIYNVQTKVPVLLMFLEFSNTLLERFIASIMDWTCGSMWF